MYCTITSCMSNDDGVCCAQYPCGDYYDELDKRADTGKFEEEISVTWKDK